MGRAGRAMRNGLVVSEIALAVVVLIHYTDEGKAEAVKKDWTSLLTETGYRRVVFLRALNSMKVNGLPVLANGG